MRRRVLSAVLGAGTAATLLAGLLVSVPWRPVGTLLVLVLLGVVAPAVAAVGAVAALRVVDHHDLAQVARLTALGTPFSVLLVLFSIHSVALGSHPGAQQVAALLLGCCLAAGLGARFTGPDAPDEADLGDVADVG